MKQTKDSNGVVQDASKSGGFLGSYRFYFTRHSGVEFNYGYTLDSQRYGQPGSLTSVQSFAHEATAAYVLRHPMGRITPYVLAGTGAIVYHPTSTAASTFSSQPLGLTSLSLSANQAKPTFLYGGGVDFNLTKNERLFFRAQYRGLVYNAPDFGASLVSGRLSHMAEPTAGLGFRF